jgi:acetyl esterase
MSPAAVQTALSAPAWTETTVRPAGLAPLPARVYGRKPATGSIPLVLHFHAGAFTSGSLESGSAIASLIAEAGAVVVSVDYPLAPQHPFPQAVETGYAALTVLHKLRAKLAGADAPLVVAGEEAGGNIAAAVALMARDRQRPQLAGQILFSPMLDACVATASSRKANVGHAACKWALGWQDYLKDVANPSHPYAVPGRAMRLAGLPSTLLITAEDDPIRDEALAFAQRLHSASVPTQELVVPGTTGWPASYGATPDSALPWPSAALERCREFLSSVRATDSHKSI